MANKRLRKKRSVKRLESDLEYVKFLLESEEQGWYDLVDVLKKCLPYVEENNTELTNKIKEIIHTASV